MSQISNSFQPQIDNINLEQANAEVLLIERVPPAGLGTHHSIGKTVARVVLALVSFGFSELIFGIIRMCSAMLARPIIHLPNNIMGENEAIARRFIRGGAVIQQITERSTGRAVAIFGRQIPLSMQDFKRAMLNAIGMVRTELTNASLEALADNTAKGMMVEDIIKDLLDKEPLNATLTDHEKMTISVSLFRSPEVDTLKSATVEEEVVPAVLTLKKKIAGQAAELVVLGQSLPELFATGLKSFSDATGLAPGSFTLNLGRIQRHLDLLATEIHKKIQTPEDPYATVSKEQLVAALTPHAESLFNDQASVYNSIVSLNIPEKLKQAWLQECMDSTSPDSSLFVIPAATADELKFDIKLEGLFNENITLENKVEIIKKFALKQQQILRDKFGPLGMQKLGGDEQGLILLRTLEALFAKRQSFINRLRNQPGLMEDIALIFDDNREYALTHQGQQGSDKGFLAGDLWYSLLTGVVMQDNNN